MKALDSQPIPVPTEPVSAAAHLSRSPRAAYTEVDRVSVLCNTGSRRVHAVSPAFASLWPYLDGRSLSEAVAAAGIGDLDRMDPTLRRSLIEAVRRAKAVELLVDVAPANRATWTPAPINEPHRPPASVMVQGELTGSDECRALRLTPGAASVTIDLRSDDSDLTPSVDGVPLTAVSPSEPALSALGTWVTCLVDPGDPWHPGLLDALASLAERFSVSVPAGSAP